MFSVISKKKKNVGSCTALGAYYLNGVCRLFCCRKTCGTILSINQKYLSNTVIIYQP